MTPATIKRRGETRCIIGGDSRARPGSATRSASFSDLPSGGELSGVFDQSRCFDRLPFRQLGSFCFNLSSWLFLRLQTRPGHPTRASVATFARAGLASALATLRSSFLHGLGSNIAVRKGPPPLGFAGCGGFVAKNAASPRASDVAACRSLTASSWLGTPAGSRNRSDYQLENSDSFFTTLRPRCRRTTACISRPPSWSMPPELGPDLVGLNTPLIAHCPTSGL